MQGLDTRPVVTASADRAPGLPSAQALALEADLRALLEPHGALAQALAGLGDIDLPAPAVPTHNRAALAVVVSLYLVFELEPLLRAADRVCALWASGALTLHLPKLEPALAKAWRERRLRLSAEERNHLLGLVFSPSEFPPAMRRVCQALTALADNAGQHDMREEVGLQHACESLLELTAQRVEGAPSVACDDLVRALREATQWLTDKTLQTAMGVHDMVALVRICVSEDAALSASLRNRLDRARGGSVVLQWLASSAAAGFVIDPRDAGLQAVIGAAERWLLAST